VPDEPVHAEGLPRDLDGLLELVHIVAEDGGDDLALGPIRTDSHLDDVVEGGERGGAASQIRGWDVTQVRGVGQDVLWRRREERPQLLAEAVQEIRKRGGNRPVSEPEEATPVDPLRQVGDVDAITERLPVERPVVARLCQHEFAVVELYGVCLARLADRYLWIPLELVPEHRVDRFAQRPDHRGLVLERPQCSREVAHVAAGPRRLFGPLERRRTLDVDRFLDPVADRRQLGDGRVLGSVLALVDNLPDGVDHAVESEGDGIAAERLR